jgi:hypothetical protein
MLTSSPAPFTSTQIIHLVGGPLCGADLEAPPHASEMTFDASATHGDPEHRISLAGDAYYYSAYLTVAHQRPTFRHASLPWNFGSR